MRRRARVTRRTLGAAFAAAWVLFACAREDHDFFAPTGMGGGAGGGATAGDTSESGSAGTTSRGGTSGVTSTGGATSAGGTAPGSGGGSGEGTGGSDAGAGSPDTGGNGGSGDQGGSGGSDGFGGDTSASGMGGVSASAGLAGSAGAGNASGAPGSGPGGAGVGQAGSAGAATAGGGAGGGTNRGCEDDDACDDDEYCKKATCEADTGQCTAQPDDCAGADAELAPVCGCDGMTYYSPCVAAHEGTNLAARGECATSVAAKCTRADGGASCSPARDRARCYRPRQNCSGSTTPTQGVCWVLPHECPKESPTVRYCGGTSGGAECIGLCEILEREDAFFRDSPECAE